MIDSLDILFVIAIETFFIAEGEHLFKTQMRMCEYSLQSKSNVNRNIIMKLTQEWIIYQHLSNPSRWLQRAHLH